MTSKNQIMQELAAKLATQESGAWSKLVSSLIGRELLAFGAEVIMASDNVVDSLKRAFDYKSADLYALVSMSHVLETPLSFIKPAYVRVRLTNNTDKIFKPFDLVYQVGTAKFTNIDYVTGADDITLYQGTVRSVRSGETIVNYNIDEDNTNWVPTIIPISEDEQIQGQKLGQVMPESIHYFYKQGATQQAISLYQPLLSDGSRPLYKVFALLDKSALVITGDGNWGKRDYGNASFQLIWLEPTDIEFSADGNLYSASVSGKITFELEGSASAVTDSYEYARDYLRAFYLKNNAVLSKEQLRTFVNAYPYVQDSSVTATEGTTTIYIKPTDPSDYAGYEDIMLALSTYGSLQVNHIVKKGSPVVFSFIIITDKTTNKAAIEDYLSSKYAYNKVNFDTIIDVAGISAELQSSFGTTARVMFYIDRLILSSESSGKYLSFIPDAGSVVVFEEDPTLLKDVPVGFDINGSLKAIHRKTDEHSVEVKDVLLLNDKLQWGSYFVDAVASDALVHGFYKGQLQEFDVNALTAAIGQLGLDECKAFTSNGFTLIKSDIDNKCWVYDVNQINPHGLISVVSPISWSPYTLDSNSQGWLYDGSIFMRLYQDTKLMLALYDGVTSSPYFVLDTGLEVEPMEAIFSYGDLYIRINDESLMKMALIRNYNSPKPVASILDINLGASYEGYQVIGLHAYKQNKIAIIIATPGTTQVKLLQASGITVINNQVQFVGQIELAEVQLTTLAGANVVCTEDFYVIVSEDDTMFVQLDASSGTYAVYSMTSEVTYPVYTEDGMDNIGSVNYFNGQILYTDGSSRSYKISYESRVTNLSEDSYLVLSESNPVLWN